MGEPETNMKVAVIDVGYNSLKMVKYRVHPDGSIKAYGQLGVMARLGEGLEHSGYLGREPIARTIAGIRLCSEAAATDSIKHVLLIGTSPVREAVNREEFLRKVLEETGLKMRVLTGNEEALYAFLGAARSVDAGSDFVLYFDLGGGSLEMTYAEESRVRRIFSLPLGALKVTGQYVGKGGKFSRKSRARMGKRISQVLPNRRELGLAGETVLVGTGGTVRALARFEQDTIGYPLNKIHNYSIDVDSVRQMTGEFFRLDWEELGEIDAIGGDRSETIAAGAIVVKSLMERLGFKRMVVSTHGLRDGILAEFVERGVRASNGLAGNAHIELLLQPPGPSTRLAEARDLAACMARNGIIDGRQEAILVKALERGRAPDSIEAEVDSLFGILMSEDLPMSHEDQLFMAISLVRARKSRTANWLLKKYGSMLKRNDVKSVRKMGATLRLMEVLDRSDAHFKAYYSQGLRIVVFDGGVPFPLDLARLSAAGLSVTLKRPVTVSMKVQERKRLAGPVGTAS